MRKKTLLNNEIRLIGYIDSLKAELKKTASTVEAGRIKNDLQAAYRDLQEIRKQINELF